MRIQSVFQVLMKYLYGKRDNLKEIKSSIFEVTCFEVFLMCAYDLSNKLKLT